MRSRTFGPCVIFASLAWSASVASAQILIGNGSVSGFSGGNATPVGGGETVDATQTNTPFTVNASQSSGSGGTSGGLGPGDSIGRSSINFNVTNQQARGGTPFSLRITALGMAEFDTVNYSGGIGSNALLDTLFITIGGSGPMQFLLVGSGDWSFLPQPGTIQPLGGSGGSINGNMLTPGSYVISLPSVQVNAGTSSTNNPSFSGDLLLIVPGPPVSVTALCGVVVASLRRRR